MVSIVKSIDKQFKVMKEREWNYIFYYFDIHETISYPDYGTVPQINFYPHSRDVLQYLSKRPDIKLGLYTCSYPKQIQKYVEIFKEHDIHFDFTNNRNGEVKNTTYGYYEDKPYYNVLFEDKAGFDAEHDWLEIKEYFGI
jgi:hypothetical protein